MKVVWTQEAETSFNTIIDYLLEKWTVKEAEAFIDFVEETVGQIVIHPQMFKTSKYDIHSREAFITKHTTMFYRIVKGTVEIEYFWGNFQSPGTLKELLGR